MPNALDSVTTLDEPNLTKIAEDLRQRVGLNVINAIVPSSLSERPAELGADGSFWLGSLQSPMLRLRRSIKLSLLSSDEHIVLEWPEANSIFGYGSTLSSAVTDFRIAVTELFMSLDGEDNNALGPEMLTLRQLLRQNIGRVVGP